MGGSFPLSASQQLFWTGQSLVGDAPVYNMGWRFDLFLRLDADLFAQAFQDVASASDIMSARFFDEGGSGRQYAAQLPAFPSSIELSEEELAHFIQQQVTAPFDLSQGSFRTSLVKLSENHWVWIIVQHHIACDAQSGAILFEKVSDRYQALQNGAPEQEAGASYFDLIDHPDKVKRAPDTATGFPYGSRPGSNAASERVPVPFDATMLDAISEDPAFRLFTPDLTRHALYLTAFAAFLSRVTDDETISIGTPAHNRITAEHRVSLGLFVEVLPFVVEVTAEDCFRSLFAKVRSRMGEFLKTARPGAVAQLERTGFAAVLNYINASFDNFAGAPVQAEWIHPRAHDAQHAIRLHVMDFDARGPKLAMDVNTSVGEVVDASEVARQFATLIEQAIGNVDQVIETLDFSAPKRCSTETGAPQPACRSVVDMFLQQVARTPDAVAVEQGGRQLTYKQLSEAATGLAAALSEKGVGPDKAVALHMARSVEYVTASLAAMMLRAHFVPISTSNPAERALNIVQRLNLGAVVADAPRWQIFEQAGLPVVGGGDTAPALDVVLPEPGDIAYVIFTSGSTGEPKGVEINHDGLARYIDWAARSFGGPDYPLFTSISFDLTITSLFVPLATGGRILVYPEAETGPDMAVLDVFRDDRVDTVKLTPAHLSLVCEAGQKASRIKTLVLGGENLSVGLSRRARQTLGPVRILNEYGPTEAVVGCMVHEFDEIADTGHAVPIGRPADGVTISLRDPAGNIVPQGVVGEVAIAGRLAAGYTDPEQTMAKFVDLGGRTYLSGDLGRIRKDGVLEYLGRADSQLKLGGVRVEPAEIENALLANPRVLAAYVGQPAQTKATQSCARCGLNEASPGVHIEANGLCNVCNEFDTYKHRAQAYFAPSEELHSKIDVACQRRTGKYDAIMLLSGGKDSTYAAYRLSELTGNVLALTLNNGFLSEQAMENVRRVSDDLGWDHRFMETEAMNEIFVDSLKRHSNVCNGCFKTVYTLALRVAREEGVAAIVTGLSRGQFFETRLTPELFKSGAPSRLELEEMTLDARRRYHAEDDGISKLLRTDDLKDGRILDEVEIIDLYRYTDVPVSEIYRYLSNTSWRRPQDTGRSTNCLINDLGIYFHKKREGYHNYALPYSWDVRMGHKTREQAMEELNDQIDEARVKQMLSKIGFDEPVEKSELIAYVATSATEAEIWDGLKRSLPAEFMPDGIVLVEELPITPNGKVDRAKLPRPRLSKNQSSSEFVAPVSATEIYLSEVFCDALGLNRIGLHDDFFHLGGDSLLAVRIAIKINDGGYSLPSAAIFEQRTVARLAAYLESETSAVLEETSDSLVELDDDELASIVKALN